MTTTTKCENESRSAFCLFGLLASLCAVTDIDAAQPLFATGINTALTSNSVLYRIDDYPTAPKAVKIGDTGKLFSDLAIDPTTQRIYAIEVSSVGNNLYELDPTNGTATLIQNTGTGFVGLAFDRGGQLWGWGGNGGLYKINKQTGLTNLVGLSGFLSGGDLAFDTNGTLYATAGGATNPLIRLNTNTGIGTWVGNFGTTNEMYGLEIDTDGVMYGGRGNHNGSISTGRAELYLVNKTNAALTLIGAGAIDCAGTYSLGGLSFLGNTNPPAQPTDSIYVAVEVGWRSESNRLYQVQWRTNISSGAWSNLDGWVLGNGSTNYIFDSTRGADRRFYRVQALP